MFRTAWWELRCARIEGKANPLAARRRPLRAAATAHGARIRTGQQVIAIERSADGFEVRTAHETHRARRVVNAAGINAGRLAGMVGASIDIQAFAMQLSVTEPAAPLAQTSRLLAFATASR